MLDVHPPHESVHTWKDFLIHMSAICLGLLIAIGLEQTVEYLHHRHQREDLEQQMRTESENNLNLIATQVDFANQLLQYLTACTRALETAPLQSGEYVVKLPVNQVQLPVDAHGMLISPSRGTWTVAKAAGTVALLPAETAKIYARLDLAEEFEQAAEIDSTVQARYLASARIRDGAYEDTATPLRLTPARRDDLLFAFNQCREDTSTFLFRLALIQGALHAVLDGAHSLEEMYRYQGRAAERSTGRPSLPLMQHPAGPFNPAAR
jgi:hypothetical protein